MGTGSELNRRKFMEVGIYAITGAITVVSGVALTRFAVGHSFRKEKAKWIEVELDESGESNPGFSRVVLEYEKKDGWLTASARSLVYVKRVKADEIIAISAACTHLGCIVTWDADKLGKAIFYHDLLIHPPYPVAWERPPVTNI